MDETATPLGIELPSDLSTLDDKALNKALKDIAKKFAPFNDENRNVTAEDLEVMAALVEQKDVVEAALTERATKAAEAKAKSEELRARMAPVAETEPEQPAEGEQPEGEGEEQDTTPEGVPVATPQQPEAVETVEGEIVQEPALAMAASTTPKSKGLARRSPASAAPRSVPASATRVADRGENLSIVASSDIPGISTGSVLDRTGLGEAMHARARGLKNGSDQVLVASIVNNAAKNDVSNITDDEGIRKAWATAHDEKSLVASGGWCAPSETVYDFVCDYESLPDALDLPSVTTRRGGLRYPVSPLLADVFADVNSGFTWTEADDIAAAQPGGPTKPCFTIPCPDFDECRLEAQGICVTAGNLTDRAYPELTNRYIDLVLTAHAHRMNALTIQKVRANSTVVAPTVDADLGAAESTWGTVEFLVNRFRDEFFAGEDFMLEGVLPRWSRSVIRRDIARRNGTDMFNITNAQIDAAFREIGARFQFVSNYQPLQPGSTAYPTQVEFLLYPAGAHTRLDGGSLDLGVVRDSTLNATNDYTAAWTEEFWQVCSRCASYAVTVPVCANGHTGIQADFTCPTV